MILKWLGFLESVKVKGLKKAIKSQCMFGEIGKDFKDSGLDFKKLLRKICKQWGIKGELKSYKSGSFGVTFLSDDKTLKITTSESEAQMISNLIKKKIPSITHIIKYYKVSRIPDRLTKGGPYYVILMEQIRPLETEECSDVLRFYQLYLQDFGFGLRDEEIAYKKKKILSQIRTNEFRDFKGYVDDMIKIIKDYEKLGIINHDIHEGNLGLNDAGHLVSFDPMGEGENIKIKKLKL